MPPRWADAAVYQRRHAWSEVGDAKLAAGIRMVRRGSVPASVDILLLLGLIVDVQFDCLHYATNVGDSNLVFIVKRMKRCCLKLVVLPNSSYLGYLNK